MARRRSHYSLEKRAKEVARQQKKSEKLKRRQQKGATEAVAEPETAGEEE